MSIKLNPDKEIVASVKEGLKKTGGYCPCRIQRTEDYKCMCDKNHTTFISKLGKQYLSQKLSR